ncbi:MAG: serine/threonine protein kinase [Myxococcales bacterium]|nr:serine/threonine protein kinase [Myxococcales bacterium]
MSTTRDDADSMIGSELGPYRIVRLLGEGAFGAVYEARKKPLDKRVALKVLHRRWARDPRISARFLQEARAAASLKHAHIVDVDDVGAVDGVPWIAMEFLEGESLASRLAREGRLSVEVALDLLFPVLSAVAAIHDANIVHRDLKLENIQLWLGSGGVEHPKLLDFGIAKVTDSIGSDPSLTGTRDVMGTPEYMAPEQWKSAKFVSAASDQWALAVILYRLVTGVSPFAGDSPQSVMFHICVDPPPPFDPSLADHAALEATLRTALAKEPADRFASVRTFAAALLPFASIGAQHRWSAEFAEHTRPPAPPRSPAPSPVAQQQTVAVALAPKPPSTNDSLVIAEQSVSISQPPNRLARVAAALGVALALGGVVFAATRSAPAPVATTVVDDTTTPPAPTVGTTRPTIVTPAIDTAPRAQPVHTNSTATPTTPLPTLAPSAAQTTPPRAAQASTPVAPRDLRARSPRPTTAASDASAPHTSAPLDTPNI